MKFRGLPLRGKMIFSRPRIGRSTASVKGIPTRPPMKR
ncbi:hypothetical protein E2C01_096007 [Portunus trituberculatus]|uniref:Uncharacterized protein n=1 Tax=Portunus trituberculatus TaxID=210409 RepID=A0A5B7JUH9_PORTR|nr:hypothetical protein [Portunus trituberculatus]